MKKFLAIILAAMMILSCSVLLASCDSSNSGTDAATSAEGTKAGETTAAGETAAAASETLYIGVYEPASGDNGAGGKQETLGIQYANTITPTVEIDGKTYNIKLEVVDNQSSSDKAVSAASQLVSKGVSVVLGSYGSGVSIAAADTFADAKIPAIGVSCTNPAVTEGNDFYYRICFLDPFQGTVLANYAKESGAKKAYVLAQKGDDYSVGLSTYFKQAFGEDNVVYEEFPEGNSDFTSYITNATNANADVFFSPTSTTSASLIIGQAKSAGAKFDIMAGDTWDNSVITEAAKDSSLDIAVTTFFDEGDDSAKGKEFVTGFKAWLNANADKKTDNGGNDTIAAVSAMGYDAYMVAVEALKKANSADSEKVAEILGSVTYDGVTGHIEFNEIGDAIRNAAYVKTVDTAAGAFVFKKIQTIEE